MEGWNGGSPAIQNRTWTILRATPSEPILITPTHHKNLRNVYIGMLWRRAEEVLREFKEITFIGYSLPGDDLHIKYLFKRALSTRKSEGPPINVVDYAADPEDSQVRRNYEGFFGKSIRYFHEGFESYVDRELGPT